MMGMAQQGTRRAAGTPLLQLAHCRQSRAQDRGLPHGRRITRPDWNTGMVRFGWVNFPRVVLTLFVCRFTRATSISDEAFVHHALNSAHRSPLKRTEPTIPTRIR